jgi:hypothetical protein
MFKSWLKGHPEYIQNIDKEMLNSSEIIRTKSLNKEKEEEDSVFIEDKLYIIRNENDLYVSVGESPPAYWIKVNNNLKEIMDTYSKMENESKSDGEELPIFESSVRGFIGTDYMLNMKMRNLESQIIISRVTDRYVWGSKWEYYPFPKKTYYGKELYETTKSAMEQMENYYSFSIETLYSRSIITIIDYEGIYIVDIQYSPTTINEENIKNLNNTLNTCYKTDMPLDVIMVLDGYPFINHKKILESENISTENLLVCNLICAGNEELIEEIIEDLAYISLESEKKSVRDAADNMIN